MSGLNRIGVIGDLHCGSRWGLTPPSYWNQHTPGMVKWLWECWQDFQQTAGELDLLIANGDLIDGKQARASGVGVITTSMGEQTTIAIDAMSGLVKQAKKTIRTEDTPYHESFEGPLGALDATFGINAPRIENRIVRDIVLENGKVLNVKHTPESGGVIYRGTGMDRELLWSSLMETHSGLPPATFILRSHLHSRGLMEGWGKVYALVPCFCMQQPYAQNRGYYRWQPSVGGVILERDDHHEHGYLLRHITYPLPTREAESYESI